MRRSGVSGLLTVAIFSFALADCAEPGTPALESAPPSASTEAEISTVEAVEAMLHTTRKGCGCDPDPAPDIAKLMALGDRVFPAYERILANPASNPHYVEQVCFMLSLTKTDRRRFVPGVAGRLEDEHGGVRWMAVQVLAEIGDERDAAPVVALLSDDDSTVCYCAAKTLAVIGGWPELKAMDEWLRSGTAHRNDGRFLQHVKSCRDELGKRLEANPFPKHATN